MLSGVFVNYVFDSFDCRIDNEEGGYEYQEDGDGSDDVILVSRNEFSHRCRLFYQGIPLGDVIQTELKPSLFLCESEELIDEVTFDRVCRYIFYQCTTGAPGFQQQFHGRK